MPAKLMAMTKSDADADARRALEQELLEGDDEAGDGEGHDVELQQ